MKKYIFFLILAVSIVINVFFVFGKFGKEIKTPKQSDNSQASTQYSLLAKRILNDFPNDLLINFLDLRSELRNTVDTYKGNFALYFEYLPTGTSVGINDKQDFFAASLFKLPVVMAYFRHKENINSNADVKVRLTQDMLDDRFGDLWQKGQGYEIGLDEAARLALINSDNTAAKALGAVITQKDFDEVYKGIDIDLQLSDKGAVMTAKNYSSILKALYFSAVLTKDDSQKILEYLTESEFKDKLAAGIPPDVTVAHKIGVIDNDSYMDCGIVYVPRRPYLLCMVSKSDEKTAQDRMKIISKTTYDFVSNTKVRQNGPKEN